MLFIYGLFSRADNSEAADYSYKGSVRHFRKPTDEEQEVSRRRSALKLWVEAQVRVLVQAQSLQLVL